MDFVGAFAHLFLQKATHRNQRLVASAEAPGLWSLQCPQVSGLCRSCGSLAPADATDVGMQQKSKIRISCGNHGPKSLVEASVCRFSMRSRSAASSEATYLWLP